MASTTESLDLMVPGRTFFAVTPHDSTDFTTNARSLYIGVTGDVTAVALDGTSATFVAVPAGSILPIRCKRVNATGTDADSIVGLT
jgi:hypothetical protein